MYYTHQLSDEAFDLARKDAHLLESEKKGQKSDLELSVDRDLIGAIAQYGVFELVESWGIGIETTPFYIPGATFDKYDFFHRGQKVDIKGSTYSTYDTFLIKQDSPGLIDPEKFMDMFCFVRVDIIERKIALVDVAGVISRTKILNPNIHTIPRVKYPAYSIHKRHLQDFRDYIFGT